MSGDLQVFRTCSELCEGLKEEFCSNVYTEILYEEIKKRTQGKTESVGMHLAKINQILFARLGLRRIQSSYYTLVTSADHIKILCRQFKAVKASMDAFVPSLPSNRCLEQDFVYVESNH